MFLKDTLNLEDTRCVGGDYNQYKISENNFVALCHLKASELI